MTTHEEIILPSLWDVKDSTSIHEQRYMYSEGCSKDLKSVLFSHVPPSLAFINGVSLVSYKEESERHIDDCLEYK